MKGGNLARDAVFPAERLFAGLACSLEGDTDHRPPLVLLHGLTFDGTMWQPAVSELRALDPGRRVLAVDLPGHGQSPAWPSYDFEAIADRVHRAVREAKLYPRSWSGTRPGPLRRMPGGHRALERPFAVDLDVTSTFILDLDGHRRDEDRGEPVWNGRSSR